MAHAYLSNLHACTHASGHDIDRYRHEFPVYRNIHFAPHLLPLERPEPHILLFKRPLGTDPVSGKVDPELERQAKKAYQQELAGKMDPHVAPMAM